MNIYPYPSPTMSDRLTILRTQAFRVHRLARRVSPAAQLEAFAVARWAHRMRQAGETPSVRDLETMSTMVQSVRLEVAEEAFRLGSDATDETMRALSALDSYLATLTN